jgi:threonine aldolase
MTNIPVPTEASFRRALPTNYTAAKYAQPPVLHQAAPDVFFRSEHLSQPLGRFVIENRAPLLPEYRKKLLEAFQSYADGIKGLDTETEQAKMQLAKIFGSGATSEFVGNGTVCNTLLLESVMDSTQALITSDIAFLATSGGNSVGHNIGAAFTTVPHSRGKVTINALIQKFGPPNTPAYPSKGLVPKVISITQPTELGTVYTIDEIRTIANYAHSKGMFLHMDGARLFYAIASQPFRGIKNPYKAMTTDAGVDLLSLGGSKHNMRSTEVALWTPGFFKRSHQVDRHDFDRRMNVLMQQLGTLSAHGPRDSAVQLLAAFQDNLALKKATQANQMATSLAKEIQHKISPDFIKYRPESNAVILTIPHSVAERITQRTPLQKMQNDPENPHNVLLRLVTNCLTTPKDVDSAVNYLKTVLQ